jgi:hypothetical protein
LDLPPGVENATHTIENSLNAVNTIGPFRTPGKRFYITNLDFSPDLDPSGEFLPYIFRQTNNTKFKVTYIPPKAATFSPVKEKLQKALNEWLFYIRTGQCVNDCQSSVEPELLVKTHKGILVDIRIKSFNENGAYPMIDSGFGYSQLLPILVKGLLLPPNGTLLVEQPEVHLNPALQIRLTDFFVSMIKARKQVIIETHSEHIVNSLRAITAENDSQFLSNKSAIYYLSQKEQKSTIIELGIQDNGMVPN